MCKLVELYQMIPEGRNNAISEPDLAALWGMRKREARKLREQMCLKDMVVCNVGGGYFRPTDEGEYEAYFHYIHEYYKAMATKLYHIKKAMEKKYGKKSGRAKA